MKRMVNRVQLIGNLGADPVLMMVGDNKPLAKFTLATHEYFRDKQGERAKETTWHQVIAWGPLAERLSGLLQKGAEVALTGKIRNRVYEDKQGQRRHVTEVVADDFYRISRPSGAVSGDTDPEERQLPF